MSDAAALTPPAGPQPAHERAQRALKALDEDRLPDARMNTQAIAEDADADRAWKRHLEGLIAFREGELSAAVTLLERAAAVALQCAVRSADGDSDMVRLAARSLLQVGCAQRRRERLTEAIRAHQAAHRLGAECGTTEDRWRNEMEIGLDDHLLGRLDRAADWFRRAIESAKGAADAPHARQARAWARLCAALSALARLDESLDAARQARDAWLAHDPGCLERFRAEAHVAAALLALAQERLDTPPQARTLIDEAVDLLSRARAELAAFGDDTRDEVLSCDERLDFARRLLAALS
jgi:tetratricopeptide (TPR) repeat protein